MLRKNTQVTLRCGEKLLDLSAPAIMGILNITPDSFYPQSRVGSEVSQITDLAGKMIEEGADILDIGGMSTRPGAEEIDISLELERVLPAVEAIKKYFPGMIISLDTYRAKVAREGIQAGATMINDISGGVLDEEMIHVVSSAPVSYVLMHMRGHPGNMQTLTDYKDLIGDLVEYFVERIRVLTKAGMSDIVIDPGFGFSKTMQQNYELIQHLDVFKMLGLPMMIGLSRKSTLSKTIGRPVEDTLEATTALHMVALMKGVKLLRVHDVKAARDAIAVYQQLQDTQNP
ncbi:MAG TPA: dihydropteroate synthase [Saprospiraceae bacterium]|nr:dihydropteroate synthase [Saprospiraceae bacterium]